MLLLPNGQGTRLLNEFMQVQVLPGALINLKVGLKVTIDIFNLTNQYIFNKVWQGAVLQNFQSSTNEWGEPVYRNSNGLKCHIGHLIPDECYSSSFEGHGASFIFECSESQVKFLERIQKAHDFDNAANEIKSNLLKVAEEYSLIIPE